MKARRDGPKSAYWERKGDMVSFIERLRQEKAELAVHAADPLLASAEAIIRGQEAIGTAPLLDLLGLPKTTGNARRISGTMRTLGFVPIKSRRLLPGGYRDTVTRGWARPLRAQTFHPVSRPERGTEAMP